MKKYLVLTVCSLVLFSSCSSDDGSSTPGPDQNYLPLATGNYWTYDVNGTDFSERDSLYVANDTTIGGTTYRKMRARGIGVGFYSGTLDNNAIRKQNGALFLTGDAGLDFGTFPIAMPVADFIVFDGNAEANVQLGTFSGTTTQLIENIPLNISYTVTSTAGSTVPVYTAPNGTAFNDVKSVTIKLNLNITATANLGGFDFQVPIMTSQDVVVSQRFYAQNIGMVYSTTNITYTLQDFSDFDITLPIPQSGNEIQTETLLSYNADL